jgi:Voltage-dependent anion channel
MTATADETDLAAGRAAARGRLARWGLLTDLEHPSQVFANLTPNWFAAVIGTGIVAVAAASLPAQFPGLRIAATAFWALAAALLVALTVATGVHWLRHRQTARGYASDTVMAHFYGAPPITILTVGAGTLLLGRSVLGLAAAVDLGWAAWLTGTALGLAAAVAVPYLHHSASGQAGRGVRRLAHAGRAADGVGVDRALLVPYAPGGQARLLLLSTCRSR